MLDIKDQSFACTQLATRTTTRVEGLLPTKQTLGELRELLVVHIRLWGMKHTMGKNPPCRWSVTCGEGELLSAKIILEIEIVFQQYVANYPSQWVLLHRWVFLKNTNLAVWKIYCIVGFDIAAIIISCRYSFLSYFVYYVLYFRMGLRTYRTYFLNNGYRPMLCRWTNRCVCPQPLVLRIPPMWMCI